MSEIKCDNCGQKTSKMLCTACGRYPKQQNFLESCAEAEKRLFELHDKINVLRNYVNDQTFDYGDQRNQVLGGLSQTTVYTIYQLNNFQKQFRSPESAGSLWIKNPYPTRTFKTISKEQLQEVVGGFDLLNRRNFLTNFLFQIEVFMKSINVILENTYEKKGYVELVRHVLKELNMLDEKQNRLNIFKIPALVRNTMHVNGPYTDNDDNGKIDNILFVFKKNESPKYAHWINLYFFVDKILDVMKELLLNEFLKDKKLPAFHDIPPQIY